MELTVILPFYDEIAFVRGAIASVRAQKLNDLEILVVNDNPDRFGETELRQLIGDPDVSIIQHDRNRGLSQARNSGLAQATGQFIGFLDSDDFYLLGGLSDQLNLAQETQADITHAQCLFTSPGKRDVRVLPRDQAFFSVRRVTGGLRAAEEAQFITSSWSSLYRRDFLDANALCFDPEQRKFEDRLFVLHTVSRARKMAFTGQPARVWRGRGGSISVTTPTPDIHLLQVQLLEKCMAHIRADVAAGRLPARFEKRELFNTVSRLIWDLDVVEAILTSPDPIYPDLARRIQTVLGEDSFGHPIFDDPILKPINRVGMRTRKGRVTRANFFDIHRHLRSGDFAQVQQIQQAIAPPPPPVAPALKTHHAKRLVLHLGLHKTGSTHIQHHLLQHQSALLNRGFLVPQTGIDTPSPQALRDGALPGHQGVVRALRSDDTVFWRNLSDEIRWNNAKTVVLSCENLSFPTEPERDGLIETLAARLSGFDQVDLVAMLRQPQVQLEAYYREWVALGLPSGQQSYREFLVNHQSALLDLPAVFTPFERAFGTRVKFGDFDALTGAQGQQPGLWPGFCALAGLPTDLPILHAPRYPTPDRQSTQVLLLLNTLVPDPDQRAALVRAWFALHPKPAEDHSALPSRERLAQITEWQGRSAQFARERGYSADLTALATALEAESWCPPDQIDTAHILDLLTLAEAQPGNAPPPARPTPRHRKVSAKPPALFSIRLRPWVVRALSRLAAINRRR